MARMGYPNHKNSRVCRAKAATRETRQQIDDKHRELKASGKLPIDRIVAKALERRGLEDLTGLTYAVTKYFLDVRKEQLEEIEVPWVDVWVRKCYTALGTVRSYPNPAYVELEKIRDANDPKAALALAILRWTDL